MHRRACRVYPPPSAFAGFQFPPEVIIVAARWRAPGRGHFGQCWAVLKRKVKNWQVVSKSCARPGSQNEYGSFDGRKMESVARSMQ